MKNDSIVILNDLKNVTDKSLNRFTQNFANIMCNKPYMRFLTYTIKTTRLLHRRITI